MSTLIWRSRDSFTERTLELFNEIGEGFLTDKRIEILLRLSCRVEHPWNAQMLHKNLCNKNMPERDRFWSIPIAIDDYEEDDEQAESISLTLIKWALNGDHKSLDDEVALLGSIVLLWLTTTTNRKIRDKSTKALARLLTAKTKVVPKIVELFTNVDDLYLQERLYAGIYGAVTNIDDYESISNIATEVYKEIFRNGEPIPYLLLRDYARGVIEYAAYKDCLPKVLTKASVSHLTRVNGLWSIHRKKSWKKLLKKNIRKFDHHC